MLNAFIQLITMQRMLQLQKTELKNFQFIQYTRIRLLKYYDNLHIKNDFKNQIID